MTDGKSATEGGASHVRQHPRRRIWPAVRVLLRTRIVAGLATVIPLWVTWIVAKFVFDITSSATAPIIDRLIGTYFKAEPGQELVLPAYVDWIASIIAVLLTLFLLYILGFLTANVFGRRLLLLMERLFENLPLVKTIYGSTKQIFLTLSGGGEGGNIYRCRADGSGLEQIATGFWNPFHLCLDAYDRLFAVDNDPDWRPPCRLLHIVPGGDYGYRFRNGRRGLHPFTSWFGQLPGTLPLVAGTGEAPSGVLAYESDHLPNDYRGDLLATSWGFHAIQRYRMKPRGASFQSAAETIIKGDQQFRPVGIALAPDGSLYVSDWVDRSYSVHGKGRIWRISAVKEPQLTRPDDPRKAIHSLHGPLRRAAARRLAAGGEAAPPGPVQAAKSTVRSSKFTGVLSASTRFPSAAETS